MDGTNAQPDGGLANISAAPEEAGFLVLKGTAPAILGTDLQASVGSNFAAIILMNQR
jgi:hypothetical protein